MFSGAAQHLSALPSSSAQIFSVRSSSQEDARPRDDDAESTAFSFSAVFVSSAGATSMRRWHPTPIEAQASRERSARVVRPSRPRNSFGPSYRPPHDERRRRRASVSRQARGRGSAIRERGAWRERERASHQARSLPDLWLMIDGSWRSTAHACVRDRRRARSRRGSS